MACRLQGESAEAEGKESVGVGGEYMNMSLGYTLNCSIRCSARQHDKYAKAQVAWLSDSIVSNSSLSPSLYLPSLLLLHARLQLGNFSACLSPSHSPLPQLMRHIPFALRFRCKLAWNVFWISFKACHTIAYPLSLYPPPPLHTLLALSASVAAAAAAALPPAAFFSISTTLKIDRHGSRFDFDKFPWPQLVERFTPRSMWGSQSPSIVYGSASFLFPSLSVPLSISYSFAHAKINVTNVEVKSVASRAQMKYWNSSGKLQVKCASCSMPHTALVGGGAAAKHNQVKQMSWDCKRSPKSHHCQRLIRCVWQVRLRCINVEQQLQLQLQLLQHHLQHFDCLCCMWQAAQP